MGTEECDNYKQLCERFVKAWQNDMFHPDGPTHVDRIKQWVWGFPDMNNVLIDMMVTIDGGLPPVDEDGESFDDAEAPF